MPNWCRNSIAISHNDPAMIERMAECKGNVLETFIPCPYSTTPPLNLTDEPSTHTNDGKVPGDWYSWRIDNWGIKWDIELNDVTIGTHFDGSGKTLYAEFDSAWSPPLEAYNKLRELGFVITAMYKELGMMFCGIYDSDGDENIEARIDFDDSDWRDKLPEALAEYLEPDYQDHLEYMREMENENDEAKV